MIGVAILQLSMYVVRVITSTKTKPIPPLEMGREKFADELEEPSNTPNILALNNFPNT
jgi:hypothetical protein